MAAMRALAVALACVAAPAAPAAAQSAQPAATDAQSAARGRQLYGQNCLRCHGPNMVNTGAFAYDLRKFPADGHERFRHSVINGKNAMPAWRDILKDEDIEALWAYVMTRGAR